MEIKTSNSELNFPIPGMKNHQLPSLAASGLENDANTPPGFGLFFPGWSKTSKRTRTRPGKAPGIIPGSDNEKSASRITRPGRALMCIPASEKALSGSDNGFYDFSGPENGESVTENLPPKKRKLESAYSSNAGNSKSTFPSRPLIIHSGGNFSRSRGKDDRIRNPGIGSSGKGKDLVTKDIVAYKDPIKARKHHVCDICGRVFKSYQALGGHKSHHNYVDSMFVYSERPEGRFNGHKCPFCDRMFSKGQALGGHKRHCRRTMYCGGGQETSNGHAGFSFDLNEFPPECASENIGTDGAC